MLSVLFFFECFGVHRVLQSFPTRRSSDLFLLLHQIPQRSGVLHRQPHAAMRHCTTKIALLVSAVDSVSRLSEEDRIGHRRVVVLVAIVVDLHAEWLKLAARCVVAASPCCHRPVVKMLAIDRNSHALSRFVHLDEEVGVGGLAERKHRDGGGSQRRNEVARTHLTPIPALITLNGKSIELVLSVVWLRFSPRLG